MHCIYNPNIPKRPHLITSQMFLDPQPWKNRASLAPNQDSSHQLDYYIFRLGNPNLNLYLPRASILGGLVDPNYAYIYIWDATLDPIHRERLTYVSYISTHLKNMPVKLDHFPKDRDENNKRLKPPPSIPLSQPHLLVSTQKYLTTSIAAWSSHF